MHGSPAYLGHIRMISMQKPIGVGCIGQNLTIGMLGFGALNRGRGGHLRERSHAHNSRLFLVGVLVFLSQDFLTKKPFRS